MTIRLRSAQGRQLKPRVSLTASLLFMLMNVAHATNFYKWEMVELPASSGASCSNGTPYRFFVNRSPSTSRMVLNFEGGGACYEKANCLLKKGFLGAFNPNGIPADYMTTLASSAPKTSDSPLAAVNLSLLGFVTPFSSRMSPSKVQTQGWNIVFLPYCTGDTWTGRRSVVYTEPDGSAPIVYHHVGNINAEAAIDWLAKNMARPERLLVTGISAGSIGATSNYPYVRDTLKPVRSALLADSGPLFNARIDLPSETAPSVHLFRQVQKTWGLREPGAMLDRVAKRHPELAAVANNLGELNVALGKLYPQDRIAFTGTNSDPLFGAFAYDDFVPEIRNAPTIEARDAVRVRLWRQEVDAWIGMMKPYPNVGYYLPYSRPTVMKSHTMTMLTFNHTDIPEAGKKSIVEFVDDLIDGTGPVWKIKESPVDKVRTPADKFMVWLQDRFFENLGL